MKSKALSVPYLIWMCIFIIIPLGLVIYFAFTTQTGNFTLSNLFLITKYLPVLLHSIWLAFIATIICLVLGFPIAYMISRAMPNKQTSLLMLMLLPMWINYLLRTYAWITLLDKEGIINQVLRFLHLPEFSNMLGTQGAVVLGMVYNYLPFMILPIYSVMTKIDDSIIEAARDLGSNSKNVISKIIIPLSLPGIYTGITMVFVPSISTFIISRMLGQGKSDLIGDIIELQFLGSSYNPQLGSALALVLMVIVLLIMSIFNQFGSEDKAI
jgi:spermidine/putrescine transport system permease protein